jgi:hypothetical protein
MAQRTTLTEWNAALDLVRVSGLTGSGSARFSTFAESDLTQGESSTAMSLLDWSLVGFVVGVCLGLPLGVYVGLRSRSIQPKAEATRVTFAAGMVAWESPSSCLKNNNFEPG